VDNADSSRQTLATHSLTEPACCCARLCALQRFQFWLTRAWATTASPSPDGNAVPNKGVTKLTYRGMRDPTRSTDHFGQAVVAGVRLLPGSRQSRTQTPSGAFRGLARKEIRAYARTAGRGVAVGPAGKGGRAIGRRRRTKRSRANALSGEGRGGWAVVDVLAGGIR